MLTVLKNPLIIIAILFFTVVLSVAYKKHLDDQKMLLGGTQIRIINNTDAVLKCYSSSERKYITRSLQANVEHTFGPFPNRIGKPNSTITIESKKWDRPIVLEFKGHGYAFSKKIIENRKIQGKNAISGIPLKIKIHVDWPLFSNQNGYNISITPVTYDELPNFGVMIKRLFGYQS